MMDKRANDIDRLLSELKAFEASVQTIKNNNSLPFSFFRESFNRTQEINSLLHNLEFMQVDDMKEQMERLLQILSETGKKEQEKKVETGTKQGAEHLSEVKDSDYKHFIMPSHGNRYSVGVELPGYKNPHSKVYADNTLIEETDKHVGVKENNAKTSINDAISTPPAIVDLKRGLSVNDRFLFQRELFGNNSQQMNESMNKLSTFETYEQAENYLRENKSWDFEDSTVLEFLSVIEKGLSSRNR